jgi:hypothetical protein
MKTLFFVAALLFAGLQTANAANYPCSGKKGGISHCEGATFVCNDGTASGSKRNCSAERSRTQGASSQPQGLTGSNSACPCSENRLCTGPRGGKYCITAGGNKSYKQS